MWPPSIPPDRRTVGARRSARECNLGVSIELPQGHHHSSPCITHMTKAKKTLVTAIAIATLGISAAGVGTTFAAQDDASGGRFDGLVQAIAARFNVDEAEVREVFEEQRAINETAHEQKMRERLDQAVADGDLTQAQADAIAAKLDELKSAREALKDLDPEEAHEVMKENMDALRDWAEENGIPRQYLPMFGPRGPHHGHGPHGGQFPNDIDE